MPPKFYKHKLLLDEGIFRRKTLNRVNSRYNTRHVSHDLKKDGISDQEVYDIARTQKRIIVTYNILDYKKLVNQSNETGVIGITQKLTPEKLDTRLNSLLSRSTEKTFYGKYTPLGDAD